MHEGDKLHRRAPALRSRSRPSSPALEPAARVRRSPRHDRRADGRARDRGRRDRAEVRIGQLRRTDRPVSVVELMSASPVDFGSDGNTVSLIVPPGGGRRAGREDRAEARQASCRRRAPPRGRPISRRDEPRLTVAASRRAARAVAGAPPTAGTPEAPAVAWPAAKPARSDVSARLAAPAARADAQAAAMHRPSSWRSRSASQRRAATEDWAGVVALYGTNTDAIRHEVDSTARASVADAPGELGLGYTARKLLGPVETNEAPALRIARAELDAHDGAIDDATSMLVGLDDATVDPALVPKLRRLRTRLALARGDVEAAATSIGNRAAPELRAEIAHAALESGCVPRWTSASAATRSSRTARRSTPTAGAPPAPPRPPASCALRSRVATPRRRCGSRRARRVAASAAAPRRVRDRGDADGRGPRDGDPRPQQARRMSMRVIRAMMLPAVLLGVAIVLCGWFRGAPRRAARAARRPRSRAPTTKASAKLPRRRPPPHRRARPARARVTERSAALGVPRRCRRRVAHGPGDPRRCRLRDRLPPPRRRDPHLREHAPRGSRPDPGPSSTTKPSASSSPAWNPSRSPRSWPP